MTYTRQNPSPHYSDLTFLYSQMHNICGAPEAGLTADEVFSGISLRPHLETIRTLIDAADILTILDYGSGKGRYWSELDRPDVDVALYDPGIPQINVLPQGRYDMVVCTDVMEHVHEDDVPWVLREIVDKAHFAIFMTICTRLAVKRLPDGRNAHITVKPKGWWDAQIKEAIGDKVLRALITYV